MQLISRNNDVQGLIAYMSTIKYPCSMTPSHQQKSGRKGKAINYDSKAAVEGRPPQTSAYNERTAAEMSNRFPNLPNRVLKKITKENNGWFTPSFRAMERLSREKNTVTGAYKVRRLSAYRSYIELSLVPPDASFDCELQFLKNREDGKKSKIDRLLEIKEAKEKEKEAAVARGEETTKVPTSEKAAAAAAAAAAAGDSQEVIMMHSSSGEVQWLDGADDDEEEEEEDQEERTCPVCYDDYTSKFMTPCSEGHDMCGLCLKQQVMTIVGDMDRAAAYPSIVCFGGHDGCVGTYSEHDLSRAVPPNTMKKLEEMRASIALEKNKKILEANGDVVFSCPACAVPALCPAGMTVFACPNVECGIESCMLCKKKSHVPLRCAEVVADEQNNQAHAVEEEMTNALLRECPNCKAKLIKGEGCNKIVCSRCRHAMCYQCNQEIPNTKEAYTHFCQTPHCKHTSCNKCVLWDRDGAKGRNLEDAKKVREAGERATKELREKLIREGKSKEEVEKTVEMIRKKHVDSVNVAAAAGGVASGIRADRYAAVHHGVGGRGGGGGGGGGGGRRGGGHGGGGFQALLRTFAANIGDMAANIGVDPRDLQRIQRARIEQMVQSRAQNQHDMMREQLALMRRRRVRKSPAKKKKKGKSSAVIDLSEESPAKRQKR